MSDDEVSEILYYEDERQIIYIDYMVEEVILFTLTFGIFQNSE